jgi:phosphoribosylaminoimidazole-succinocarboxamide synthase
MDSTKSKKRYIETWDRQIDTLHILRLTPTRELGDEMEREINKIKALVRKIAKDKGLK